MLLATYPQDDEFVAAVLNPDYPLVVVVHDEAASQVRNPFEQSLIGPILRTLADKPSTGWTRPRGSAWSCRTGHSGQRCNRRSPS